MEQLFERVKAILLTPQTEWQEIAREPSDTAGLFSRYVAILALIPALAGFIGSSLIGRYSPILSGIVGAIVSYVLAFVVTYVVALIVDALAPTFGAQKNFPNALKLAVYSYTPVWLAGIFLLIPGLSFLTVLGLYGLYLLWLGLPPLMQAPRDKALPYAGAVVLAALIIQIVIGALLGVLFFAAR
jgi:sterol desaturase/sphingolipid hydroxylase (fatty acid hydroxylase superfamily)